MTAKILICDNAVEYGECFRRTLETEGMRCLFCAAEGKAVLKAISEYMPDIVLCGAVMPACDAATLIYRTSSENSLKPFFIVTAPYKNPLLEMQIMSFPNAYFMLSPFDAETFVKVVRQILCMPYIRGRQDDLHVRAELAVTGILHQLRVPSNVKGYRYIREAAILALDDCEMLECVTKVLYAELANRFDTTSARVERAIRTAIESAWKNGGMEQCGGIFNSTSVSKKPSNTEFISAITDNLRLRFMFENASAM